MWRQLVPLIVLVHCISGCLRSNSGEFVIEPVCLFRIICFPLPHYYDFNIADSIRLVFYTGTTVNDSVSHRYNESNMILNHPSYNYSKLGCVFYIHGWTEGVDVASVETVMEAYMAIETWNLVAVNISQAFGESKYLASVKTIPNIARALSKAVNQFSKAGQRVHLVGHSLGAHVAGYTAKHAKGKIYRVTALDPANFKSIGLKYVLNENIAHIVDAIHTNENKYGDEKQSYSKDFFPNGGMYQPGCPRNETWCSHRRSWRYYAESVTYPQAFPALPCDSWNSYVDGRCDDTTSSPVYMGYLCNANASGKYFLRTNEKYPYGLGEH